MAVLKIPAILMTYRIDFHSSTGLQERIELQPDQQQWRVQLPDYELWVLPPWAFVEILNLDMEAGTAIVRVPDDKVCEVETVLERLG